MTLSFAKNDLLIAYAIKRPPLIISPYYNLTYFGVEKS